MRNTVQRQIILEAVSELAIHPTAEDVYLLIAKKHPAISKATVYRNLDVATKSGEIISIGVFDGATRFDHNNTKHYHFVCESCKEIIDVPYFDLNEKLLPFPDFSINKIELTLRGICKKCNKDVAD